MAKGILNATRRTSWRDPSPITPGQPVDLVVDIDATGSIFETGHRIGLSISGGDFQSSGRRRSPAVVDILEGRLVLPVVPPEGSARPVSFRPSETAAVTLASTPARPTWEHRIDVLTGVEQVIIRTDRAWQIDADTAAAARWS